MVTGKTETNITVNVVKMTTWVNGTVVRLVTQMLPALGPLITTREFDEPRHLSEDLRLPLTA